MKKFLLLLQIGILLAGSIFAWYTVYHDFSRFYQNEGTIFKIHDCITSNPVTTACFYGAIGFVVAFVWAILIYQGWKHQKYLFWFLFAGTLFAWFNTAKVLITYYSASSGPKIGCSAQVIVNPYTTPCFIGASLFFAAFIVSAVVRFKKI